MGMMAQRAVALLVFCSSIAWVAAGNSQISPAQRNSLFKVSACYKNSPGYYVDESNPCKVVNYCLPDGTVVRLRCPPGTSVNQIDASCDAKIEVTECRRRIRKRRQAPQSFNSPQFVTLLTNAPSSSSNTFQQRTVQVAPQAFFGQPFMIIAPEPQPSSPRRTITPRPRPQHLDNRASPTSNTATRPTSGSSDRGRRLMETQFVSLDDHLIRAAIDNNANQASSFIAPDQLRATSASRSSPPRRPSQQQQPSQQQRENINQNQNERQDPFFPPPFFDSNPNFPPRPFFSNLPRPQFPSNSPDQFRNSQRAQGNNFISSPNDNAIVQDVHFPGPPQNQAANSQATDEARRPSFRPSRLRPSDQSFRQQQQDEEEQDRQQQLHLQQNEDERIFQRPFQSHITPSDQPFRPLPPPIQLQRPQQGFFQEQFPVAQRPFPPRRPFRPTQTEAPPTTTTTATTRAPISPAPQEEFGTQNRFRFGSLRPTIDGQRPQSPSSSLPPTQSQLQPSRRPLQPFQQQSQQVSPETQQFGLERPSPQQFPSEPQQFVTPSQPQQFQTERPQSQQFQTEQTPLKQFQTEQPIPQQFETERPQQFAPRRPQQFAPNRPQQFPPRRPQQFQQEQQQFQQEPEQIQQEPQQSEPESPTFQPEQTPEQPAVPPNRGRGRFRPSFQDEFDLPTTTPSPVTFFQTDNPENTGLAPVTDDFGFKLDSTFSGQPTPPSFQTTFADEITPESPSTDFSEDFSDFSDGPATTTERPFATNQGFGGNDETTAPFDITTQAPSTFGVEESDLETKEEPATTHEIATTTPAPLDTTSTLRPTRVRRPLGPRPRPRVRTTTSTQLPPSDDQQEETSTSSSAVDGSRRRIRPFARRRRPLNSRTTSTESSGISVEEVTTAATGAGATTRPVRRRRPLSALMAARRRKPIVGDSDTAASTLLATSPVTEDTLATATEEQIAITVTEVSPVQETDETDQTEEVSTTTTPTTTQDGGESKDKSRLRNLFSRRFVLKKPLARPVASR